MVIHLLVQIQVPEATNSKFPNDHSKEGKKSYKLKVPIWVSLLPTTEVPEETIWMCPNTSRFRIMVRKHTYECSCTHTHTHTHTVLRILNKIIMLFLLQWDSIQSLVKNTEDNSKQKDLKEWIALTTHLNILLISSNS